MRALDDRYISALVAPSLYCVFPLYSTALHHAKRVLSITGEPALICGSTEEGISMFQVAQHRTGIPGGYRVVRVISKANTKLHRKGNR